MKSIQTGVSFQDALLRRSAGERHLGKEEIDALLEPERYTGLASQITRNVVALTRGAYERRRLIELGGGPVELPAVAGCQ
jgi:hypothetical protein